MLEKTCPKCNTMFEVPKSGQSRTYCSRSCANSRKRTEEIKKKISAGVKKTWEATSEEGKLKKLSALKRGISTIKQNAKERLLLCSTEELGHDSRKKKVFLEQGEKCNKCGLTDWLGNPITFELEHIDGNRHNNLRENLEVLCPNCHSQTETWRGRNKIIY